MKKPRFAIAVVDSNNKPRFWLDVKGAKYTVCVKEDASTWKNILGAYRALERVCNKHRIRPYYEKIKIIKL